MFLLTQKNVESWLLNLEKAPTKTKNLSTDNSREIEYLKHTLKWLIKK